MGQEQERSSLQRAIDPEELLTLGSDFARVWRDASTDMRLKKRMVRTLIEEIVVDVSEAGDTIKQRFTGRAVSTRLAESGRTPRAIGA
jgi:hypothetical protein